MKPRKKIISKSPKETVAFAKTFARSLQPGSVVALEGDLGSGKTTFIKGVALGLGLRNADKVKSPTFVLMHLYETRVPLYHFDLYRLNSPAELQAIGFEEFVYDPRGISCIEWAEKASDLIPQGACRITLAHAGKSRRRIEIRK